jgi:hypothetical protein
VLRVVFTIFVWLQLCTSALHVGRSVFCFLEPLLGASQLVLPGRRQPLHWGRMGDGKRNKVKKSIWKLLCGCSSPQTTDWSPLFHGLSLPS